MNTNTESKINKLLQIMPRGAIVLASWLNKQGYSHNLQQQYIRSNWLEPVGTGAFKRTGDEVDIFAALYTLQSQAGKTIHIGGRSSLSLLGYTHHIKMQQPEIILFAPHGLKLPAWFLNYNWQATPVLIHTSMLPPDFALTEYGTTSFKVKISNTARAMLECFELSPNRFDLEEGWLIMEGLNALKPAIVQQLLEQCQSVKAKRLFLYFAEKANHSWFKHLLIDKINLGKGKRSIVKQGVWIDKYQITVPKILA
jgi:hypothetical protein